MSKCRTCEYALYDGMCLAQGKFTLLDAPACDDYKPRIDVEVSKLKAENAKLRSMVHDMRYCIKRNHRCDDCDFNVGTDCLLFVNINKRMRELGVEVTT